MLVKIKRKKAEKSSGEVVEKVTSTLDTSNYGDVCKYEKSYVKPLLKNQSDDEVVAHHDQLSYFEDMKDNYLRKEFFNAKNKIKFVINFSNDKYVYYFTIVS